MPAASSRPQTMVRSGVLNSGSTRRTSARASPGRPAHSASSAARCADSRASSTCADVGGQGVDQLPPPRWRHRYRRAAGRSRRGPRAPASASRSGGPAVSGSISAAASAVRPRRAGPRMRCRPGRWPRTKPPGRPAGRAQDRAAPPRRSSWNLASLSSASLSLTASHNRAGCLARPGQGPPRSGRRTLPRPARARTRLAARLARMRGIRAVAPAASAISSARFSAAGTPLMPSLGAKCRKTSA